jgi:Kef-type K+ transport system membrane component KefB
MAARRDGCSEHSSLRIGTAMSVDEITAYVIGDIALIIALSSLLGALARRCGQPTVIGQILTGVLAGPTVLGRLPGNLTSHLFPIGSFPI